jgi:D-arabinose 1-dehydrogenase-like Zn-dependent alcohol dehydrogenase
MKTDLMIKDGDFKSPLPLTGSHEPCGTVFEVGSNVKGFKKGDRIGTLPFMHPCGKVTLNQLGLTVVSGLHFRNEYLLR